MPKIKTNQAYRVEGRDKADTKISVKDIISYIKEKTLEG